VPLLIAGDMQGGAVTARLVPAVYLFIREIRHVSWRIQV
jgi:hypothetical protein